MLFPFKQQDNSNILQNKHCSVQSSLLDKCRVHSAVLIAV